MYLTESTKKNIRLRLHNGSWNFHSCTLWTGNAGIVCSASTHSDVIPVLDKLWMSVYILKKQSICVLYSCNKFIWAVYHLVSYTIDVWCWLSWAWLQIHSYAHKEIHLLIIFFYCIWTCLPVIMFLSYPVYPFSHKGINNIWHPRRLDCSGNDFIMITFLNTQQLLLCSICQFYTVSICFWWWKYHILYSSLLSDIIRLLLLLLLINQKDLAVS